MKQLVNLHFDGACLNNGLNNAIAGYGVVIEKGSVIMEESYGKIRSGMQTHNRAELESLLVALKWICVNGSTKHVYRLYNDNKSLVDCVIGIGRRRTNRDIWEEIESVSNEINAMKISVGIEHVNKEILEPSHNTYIFNTKADELAFIGANALFN